MRRDDGIALHMIAFPIKAIGSCCWRRRFWLLLLLVLLQISGFAVAVCAADLHTSTSSNSRGSMFRLGWKVSCSTWAKAARAGSGTESAAAGSAACAFITPQLGVRATSMAITGGSVSGARPAVTVQKRSLASKSRKTDPYTVEDVVLPGSSGSTSTSEEISGFRRPVVQWYPGHIAKAERMLKESFLKAVDVVIEVRDARIPKATAHPKVSEWCAGRPRIVVLTHVDAIPKHSQIAWLKAYNEFGAEHFSVNDQRNNNNVEAQILDQARQAVAASERNKFSNNRSRLSKSVNNKKDQKNKQNNNSQQQGQQASYSPVQHVLFVNAKEGGSTILELKRAIHKAGEHIQERRARRGLNERALRVGILGYPNVGKSALINRLLNRKRAKSHNTPGVTRSLQWIRIRTDDSTDGSGRTTSGARRGEFELLDSPGIIPMSFLRDAAHPEEAQSDALLLAACNCISDTAYDNQEVAAYLSEWLLTMHRLGHGSSAPQWPKLSIDRYRFDPLKDKNIVLLNRFPEFQNLDELDEVGKSLPPRTHRPRTGQDVLYDVAANTCQGDPEDAARKILQDFRAGRLGPICLQVPPTNKRDRGQASVIPPNRDQEERVSVSREAELERQHKRAEAARDAAAQLGLELPPAAANALLGKQDQQPLQEPSSAHSGNDDNSNNNSQTDEDSKKDNNSIGKGLFDGW